MRGVSGGSRGVGSAWRCDARSLCPRLRSASMCSRECALESWPVHKAVCRERQAVRLGSEWGRAQNRAVTLAYAALDDDTRTMQKLIDGLVAALASNKNVAKHKAVAVKAFVDFEDERRHGTPAFAAAQELAVKIAGNGPLAVKLSKQVVRDSEDWSTGEMFGRQQDILQPVFTSEDAIEGAMAFAEKRAPNWKGR